MLDFPATVAGLGQELIGPNRMAAQLKKTQPARHLAGFFLFAISVAGDFKHRRAVQEAEARFQCGILDGPRPLPVVRGVFKIQD